MTKMRVLGAASVLALVAVTAAPAVAQSETCVGPVHDPWACLPVFCIPCDIHI